jgi:hypothetical protein
MQLFVKYGDVVKESGTLTPSNCSSAVHNILFLQYPGPNCAFRLRHTYLCLITKVAKR